MCVWSLIDDKKHQKMADYGGGSRDMGRERAKGVFSGKFCSMSDFGR